MTRSSSMPGGLRALFTGGTATGMTDEQLMVRFRSRSGVSDPAAETAFGALVDRHAAMVWGVCRRGLGNRADAEDAFQATFLVLVRKAGSVRVDDQGSIGRWLYGVARRVAARQRLADAQRPASVVGPAFQDDPAIVAERREACAAVSAELDRLPSKYRRPIELCDFEGLTYEQAGCFLGWPTATIKSRLARGRLRLRGRLARRGLAPLAAMVAAELARECRAGVSPALLHSTPRVSTIASGLVPTAVARLAEGAIQTMMWTKLKPLALPVLAGLAAATWAVAGPFRAERPQDAPPAVASPGPEGSSDPQFTRTLNDGTVVEIVAVSRSPSGADTWWRPDGTPLRSAPCDPIEKGPATPESPVLQAENISIEVVVRVVGTSENREDLLMDFADRRSLGWRAEREGRALPELVRLIGHFSEDPAALSVGFRDLRGPWRTVQKWGQSESATGRGDRSLIFSGPIPTQAGTAVSVSHDFSYEIPTRIVAVDRNGLLHRGRPLGGGSVRNFAQLSLDFDVPADQIDAFHFQERSFEFVTISDIAPHPRKAEDPR